MTSNPPPVFPLLEDDPPKVGDFWLDARFLSEPSGIAFAAHADDGIPVVLILLSQGAAADAVARDRFAGLVNDLEFDTVVARGGHGQDEGRLAKKFRAEHDDPVEPDDQPLAPWVALLNDGSARAGAEASRILREVQLSDTPHLGRQAGPDYALHWIDRIKPGFSRVWPLPWPGRYDRAGWMTMVISWLLMVLLAGIAVLIAILLFQHSQAPDVPPPVPTTFSPTNASRSSSTASSSPSTSPTASDKTSASPNKSSSPGTSPSSTSASASPSESASPSQSPSGSAGGSPTPNSKL